MVGADHDFSGESRPHGALWREIADRYEAALRAKRDDLPQNSPASAVTAHAFALREAAVLFFNVAWVQGDGRQRLVYVALPAALILVALFLLCHHGKPVGYMPVIKDVTVISSVDKQIKHVTLPYSKPGAPDEKLDVNVSLEFQAGQQTIFRIIPEDCVESIDVNGQAAVLQGSAMRSRCDLVHGFLIDFKPYLKDGGNMVHLQLLNHAANIGLKFHPARRGAKVSD